MRQLANAFIDMFLAEGCAESILVDVA
jgi:hypothetical protein